MKVLDSVSPQKITSLVEICSNGNVRAENLKEKIINMISEFKAFKEDTMKQSSRG